MKRQSLVLLTVAFVAAGAAGCFKDPVSGLRGGPAIVYLDHSSVYLAPGDSVAVTASVQDNGGNVLPETDAVWASGDAAVAAVRKDTTQALPGDYITRAFIRGVQATGGATNVTVQTRGLTGTVRVVVVPPVLPGAQVSVAGTAQADTVIIAASAGPPPTPPDTVIFTAGDTLTINGTSVLQFDTSKVGVYVTGLAGVSNGIIVGKTPTQLQVAFLLPAAGKVVVTHLLLVTGNPAVGNIVIDSLIGDSVSVARKRFGALGVVMSPNNSRLGDTITVTLPAGLALSATSQALVGNTAIATSAPMWELSRTANSVTGLAKRGGGGPVIVTNVQWGAVLIAQFATLNAVPIDSVATDMPEGATQAGARTLTIPANDTAVVYGTLPPSGADFWTFTTTAAHVIKGSTAWFGSGNPYGTAAPNTVAYTEDIDFLVCDASTACDESAADLTGYAGASTSQPEAWTTASLPAAQYWIGELGFNAGYAIAYQMTIILQ